MPMLLNGEGRERAEANRLSIADRRIFIFSSMFGLSATACMIWDNGRFLPRNKARD
jgi:hypothetical protein